MPSKWTVAGITAIYVNEDTSWIPRLKMNEVEIVGKDETNIQSDGQGSPSRRIGGWVLTLANWQTLRAAADGVTNITVTTDEGETFKARIRRLEARRGVYVNWPSARRFEMEMVKR